MIIRVKDYCTRAVNGIDGLYFRNDILLPALRHNNIVEIDLDGVLECSSKFIDKAFSGLGIFRKNIFIICTGNIVVKANIESLLDASARNIISDIFINNKKYSWSISALYNPVIVFRCSCGDIQVMNIVMNKVDDKYVVSSINIDDLYLREDFVNFAKIVNVGFDYIKSYLDII